MNKKIKIIELLNKIANGEEMPQKIKYDNEVFVYIGRWEQYVTEEEEIPLLRRISAYNYSGLNDEVEVLEDNTEEIEELEKEQEAIANPKTMLQEIRFYYDSNKMGDKINEIIRYIKRKDKSND